MAFNNDKTTWTDPDTKTPYSLSVFRSFETTYEIKPDKNGETFSVRVRVNFSNHCYSRERKDESANQIIDRQHRKDGTIEERVFCQSRWDFCQNLPEIIENLGLQRCFEGDRDIIYRQERRSQVGAHDGWYICMRLEYRKKKNPAFELWVRSVHQRSNRPVNIRNHGGQKFRQLLSKFAKKKGVFKL